MRSEALSFWAYRYFLSHLFSVISSFEEEGASFHLRPSLLWHDCCCHWIHCLQSHPQTRLYLSFSVFLICITKCDILTASAYGFHLKHNKHKLMSLVVTMKWLCLFSKHIVKNDEKSEEAELFLTMAQLKDRGGMLTQDGGHFLICCDSFLSYFWTDYLWNYPLIFSSWGLTLRVCH